MVTHGPLHRLDGEDRANVALASSACGKSSIRNHAQLLAAAESEHQRRFVATPSIVDSVRASGWVHCPFV
jgi:hypothetical protein